MRLRSHSIRAVTALCWHLPVSRLPDPARATLIFLGWLLLFVDVGTAAAPVRRALEFPLDLIVNSFLRGVVITLMWLLLSWFLLPHAASEMRELVPGALVVGVGVAAIGLVNTLVLFPWLAVREEIYGVLGIAAGLLFGFFLFGRTIEISAALNATLAEERRRTVAR